MPSISSSSYNQNASKKQGKRDNLGKGSLSGKRHYPILALNHNGYSSNRDFSTQEKQKKSKLETAVLTDCLSNHFLLADCPKTSSTNEGDKISTADGSIVMVETLVDRFERVEFRKNELIFEIGDPANYLYVLYRGDVTLRDGSDNNNEASGTQSYIKNGDDKNNPDLEVANNDDDEDDDNEKYTILGELELLINSKYYKKTAKATSPCTLFRLSSNDFRTYFLSSFSASKDNEQQEVESLFWLLRNSLPAELSSYFFEDNGKDHDHHVHLLKNLLSERKVRKFRKGDVLIHKSKALHALVIITDGLVIARDNMAGGREYEDLRIGEGEVRKSFGWQSVLKMNTNAKNNYAEAAPDIKCRSETERIITGTVTAETDGQAIIITKQSFENVFYNLCYCHQGDRQHEHLSRQHLLLDVQHLFDLRWKRTQIQQIMVFKDSGLDSTQIDGLLDLMHNCVYRKEEIIFKAGDKVHAAMYFVREGSIRLEIDKGREIRTIEKGGYFGEKNMLLDQNTGGDKHHRKRSSVTATSISDSTKVDILFLEECRKVVNTTILGLGQNAAVNVIDNSVKWTDLKRHKLIGQGSYGQVWSCSTTAAQRLFALKVQPKYSLIQANIAERIVAERNVMASINSPFIMRLFNTFQDNYRLYIITSLLPGGELESIIPDRGLSEPAAKFYAAGIFEALTYMHRKHIIHRDVKTDNVMISSKGYPVLIDMGFAKYVPDKTYTFCGSPMFMAPETILYKGQNKGVDHWAWGVVVYRLVTGKFPFYRSGMDELALYKAICKGTFEVTGLMSMELRTLLIAILYPDPSRRLGSAANGWRHIFDALWFTNDQSFFEFEKLRRQELPAPLLPSCDSTDTFVHQSGEEDFFNDDICGKIPDNRQKVFNSFGSYVSSSIGEPTVC